MILNIIFFALLSLSSGNNSNTTIKTNEKNTNCFEIDDEHVQIQGNRLIIKGQGHLCDCYDYEDQLPDKYTSIEIIQIEGTVKTIGMKCFMKFKNVNQLELKEGIETIRSNSFRGISIKQLVIPSSVITIEKYSFADCNQLGSVSFSQNSKTEQIEDFAFKNCTNLQSIHVPKGLHSFNRKIVYGCFSLITITIDENNNQFQVKENVLMSKDGTRVIYSPTSLSNNKFIVPKEVETIEEFAFAENSLTSISFNYQLKEISETSFFGNRQLKRLFLPPSITHIDHYSFAVNDELEEVIITSDEITIEDNAFYGCSQLSRVYFTGNNLTISNSTFDECDSLESISVTSNYDGDIEVEWLEEKEDLIVGICGDDCHYLIPPEKKQIVIYGEGNITSFDNKITNSIKEQINKIIIEEGIKLIGDNIFANYAQLTSITIPSSVNKIGNSVFSSCSSLQHISLPNTIQSIGTNIFQSCTSLQTVVLPNTITTIPSYTFSGCSSLISFTIPSHITTIESYAFEKTNLTTITIPSTITKIGSKAFYLSNNITKVIYNEQNEITCLSDSFSNIGTTHVEVLMKYSSTTFCGLIPRTIGSCGNQQSDCKYEYNHNNYTLTINGNMISYSQTNMPWYLQRSSIKQIQLFGVKSISDYAFYECSSLTSITIPLSVTSIGNYAFYNNNLLTSIHFHKDINLIGKSSFENCDLLETVVFDGSSNVCNSDAFSLTKSTTVKVPIEYTQTLFCGLIPITINKCGNQQSDCQWEYNHNNFTLIINGNGNMNSYTSTSYPWYNKRTQITSIQISGTIQSIGDYAFYECSSYSSIIIPSSVTSIGSNSFSSNSQLKTIIYQGTSKPSCQSNAFTGNTLNFVNVTNEYTQDDFCGITTVLGSGVCGNTQTDCSWKLFSSGKMILTGNGNMTNWDSVASVSWIKFVDSIISVDIQSGILSIGNNAFRNFRSTKQILLPNTIKTIGNNAFYNCDSLNDITIPSSVISIGSGSFYSSNWLTSLTIPNGVISIGYRAFAYCTSLKTITIPKSLTSIGGEAFSYCDQITSIGVDSENPNYSSDEYGVLFNKDKTTLIKYPEKNTRTSYTIPDGVRTIYSLSFYNSNKLTSITIPNTVEKIQAGAFEFCSGLSSITIPNSVKTIESNAFRYCYKLTSISISSSVTTIGSSAFRECTLLSSFTVDSNNPNYLSDEYGVLYNKAKTSLMQYPNGNTRTSYTIPSTVTNIPYFVFLTSKYLEEIHVDSNNPNYSSDEYGVLFNKAKTEIIQYPYGNKRTSYSIPEGVTSIAVDAFWNIDSLTNIIIPSTMKIIGNYAFYECDGITSMILPSSVESIGEYAFNCCRQLKEITFSEGLKTIGFYVFYNTAITSVTIPSTVTSLGSLSFYYALQLTTIILKSSTLTIHPEAFRYCPKLTTIIYQSTTPPTCSTSISNCPTSCQFCYDCNEYNITVSVPTGYTQSSTSFCNLSVKEDDTILQN